MSWGGVTVKTAVWLVVYRVLTRGRSVGGGEERERVSE